MINMPVATYHPFPHPALLTSLVENLQPIQGKQQKRFYFF